MKKTVTIALLVLLIGAAAFSAKAAGLENFSRTYAYGDNFTDVLPDSWYADGVKSAYEYGIMTGIGAASFDPDGIVSMAQAIAVASRVHSQYYGYTIPDTGGEWFQKYYHYASKNNMLPPDINQSTDLSKNATRAFIAYVFSKSIDMTDLPAVNTGALAADFHTIPETYKESVRFMYESGIITGQEGNCFNPGGQATRAQMSVIIMRLLEPAERASSDARIDANYLAQQSNIMNSVPVVFGENGRKIAVCGNGNGGSYFTYTENNTDVLYSYKYPVSNLIMQGKYVYFLQHINAASLLDEFVKYNPSTQIAEVLFKAKSTQSVKSVALYDGTFYLYVESAEKAANGFEIYKKVYSVTADGVSKELLSIKADMSLDNKITAFNNTLYFDANQTIYCWDLNGSRPPAALRGNIRDWVMSGNTIYYSDRDNHIGKFAANYPGLNKLLATIPSNLSGISVSYDKGALFVADDGWHSTLYKYSGSALATVCRTYQKAWHLGIIDDLYFYSNNPCNDWINSEGRIGSLVTVSNTKSMYNWYFEENLPANSASLSKTSIQIPVGNTAQLNVNNQLSSYISWRSPYSDIATVDNKGVVTGMAKGTCVVTGQLSNSGQELICIVTVTDNNQSPGDSGTGSTTPPEYSKGSTSKLSAEMIYSTCSPAVFYIEVYNSRGQVFALGSGFFISKDGLAVTNYHVIEGASALKVFTTNGKSYWVSSVVTQSKAKDIAVLSIKGSGFSFLPIGDSSKVSGGQKIFAIGSPLGLSNTISDGIVSNPSRVINGSPYIQISAPISSGSSGGALINEYGQVIGITTASFVSGQNLNLAIPINQIYTLRN